MSQKGSVLIVGGGISGVQSALDLAGNGFKVHIVERNPTPGGVMGQLEKTFPTHDCAFCLLEPKLVDAATRENIDIITNSQVERLEGEAGAFKVTVRENRMFIDPSRCSDCGECLRACAERAITRVFAALSTRLSAKKEALDALQPIHIIDEDLCTECGRCKEVCKEGAVILDNKGQEMTLEVGSVILATGFKVFDPSVNSELGYGVFPNVVTSLELERMLSAPGAKAGLVARPSDGGIPKKVAFVQCVGSRDERTNTYCSSICCMAAIKEAILLVERYKVMEPTIFHMDIRSFGKEYEDFFDIARERYKVRFVNSRVADIMENETQGLVVKFVDEKGTAAREEFDMVVLSVGLVPSPGTKRLAEATGVELNGHGFARTTWLSPLSTSVEGIFGCGTFLAPKDIPDAVCDASGAAMLATIAAGGPAPGAEKGQLSGSASKVEVEARPDIGVFICRCGEDVASVIDVAKVIDEVKGLKDVIHVEAGPDYCTEEALKGLVRTVKDKDIDRIVLAGCSPRLIEPLMRRTLRDACLEPFLFEVANIREQCAWVHPDDKVSASAKACSLLRMAVSKVRDDVPIPVVDLDIERSVLVLGGGLSGMTAALAIARCGFDVHLLERSDRLGGHLHHIKHLFEGEGDPKGHLEGLIKEIEGESKVKVHLKSRLVRTEGVPGLFRSCIEGPDGEAEIAHGATIVATGAEEYRPAEYLYGKNPKVVTQSQLEEMLSSGGLATAGPGTVVMIQCVGSRTKDKPYCSRICCGVAIKNALELKRADPKVEVFVLYKDIRTYGFTEDRYREARGKGVHFVRYSDDRPPVVSEVDGGLEVSFDDPVLGRQVKVNSDLLVLSAGIHPNPDNEGLAKAMKVPISKDGFLLESHMKLRPVDLSTDGIYLCGLAHGPKSMSESTVQALAAASHATGLLSKGTIHGQIITAQVDPAKCRGCGRCEETCEYSAIRVVTETVGEEERMVSKVDVAKCRACGKCSLICCNKSITMKHFTTGQIERMIEAALEEGS